MTIAVLTASTNNQTFAMNKNLQIHVRVTPTTRKQWDDLCAQSPFKTQSALFRNLVNELHENDFMNLKNDENENN